MLGATTTPPPGRVLGATSAVADFIDACDTALDCAWDGSATHDLMPGVPVEAKAAVLKAFLLFLATEGVVANGDVDPDRFDRWYERVTAEVWELLGFAQRPPAKMTFALAFSLAAEHEHQAPEVRAVIWLVGDLAACRLLTGLST